VSRGATIFQARRYTDVRSWYAKHQSKRKRESIGCALSENGRRSRSGGGTEEKARGKATGDETVTGVTANQNKTSRVRV